MAAQNAMGILDDDRACFDELVLVDALDRPVGRASKERAHVEGLLHRAFSVVLVREATGGQQILLARRAPGKYHSAGLWGNSCCSHPRAGEDLLLAVRRRVREELNCDVSGLHEIGAFVYRAEFGNGLVEHEFDHVLVGTCVGEVTPDPAEVDAVRWVGKSELVRLLAEEPQTFAVWAHTVLPMALGACGV